MTAEQLIRALINTSLRLATAESCTGGLIAAALTDVAGSSAVFTHGFVTYSNDAKVSMLGVPQDLLLAYGAVSSQVAVAMAGGALKHSGADIAIAVTGIAGPGGGTLTKPVGLVHFACATRHQTVPLEKRFGKMDRARIRSAAVETALQLVFDCV